MGQIGTAFRAFFAALFNAEKAARIQAAIDQAALPKITQDEPGQRPAKARATAESPPTRSEAVTLLAALQRESRLVDLILEPLDSYTDEQIGAAARNVLRDSAGALERLLALKPVLAQDEQSVVDVPATYDPARLRLTGKVEGSGPFRGKLAHRGWQASAVNLPTWTGSKEAALVIAPAEIEV
ncbi:MAG: DUF2760 domain-containing protein [Planctomycetaceae bacterium]|nr:DUF2760 domain-containing protein [Planctomycetaceae bacterium]